MKSKKSSSSSPKENSKEKGVGGVSEVKGTKRSPPRPILSALVLCAGIAVSFILVHTDSTTSKAPPRQSAAIDDGGSESDSLTEARSKFSGSPPRLTDAEWSRLLAPHGDPSARNAIGSSRTASGTVRTSRLPHLFLMLVHRVRNAAVRTSNGAAFTTTTGETQRSSNRVEEQSLVPYTLRLSADMTTTAAATASRLSVVLETLHALLKVYESEEMEDAEKITDHYWPSLSAMSAEPKEGAKGKMLPHDVMLLGEWAAALSKSLRERLFKAEDKSKDENSSRININEMRGDTVQVTSNNEKLVLPHLFTKSQQLLTLCAAEADVLPHYFLITEDTARHAESLLSGVECLRALRDSVTGALIVSAEGQEVRGDERGDERRSISVPGRSHKWLEKELGLLLTNKQMTKKVVTDVLHAFAKGELCAANVTSSSQKVRSSETQLNSATSDGAALLLAESVCLERFASLAFPAGLNTKIGSLLEEAIAMDSLFPPFRVMYMAHLTLGMGRCGPEVLAAIDKELTLKRITAAPTKYYSQWLEGLRGVCKSGKIESSNQVADGSTSHVGDAAERRPFGRTREITSVYPQMAPAEVQRAFEEKGIMSSPELKIVGNTEYDLFLSLIEWPSV